MEGMDLKGKLDTFSGVELGVKKKEEMGEF